MKVFVCLALCLVASLFAAPAFGQGQNFEVRDPKAIGWWKLTILPPNGDPNTLPVSIESVVVTNTERFINDNTDEKAYSHVMAKANLTADGIAILSDLTEMERLLIDPLGALPRFKGDRAKQLVTQFHESHKKSLAMGLVGFRVEFPAHFALTDDPALLAAIPTEPPLLSLALQATTTQPPQPMTYTEERPVIRYHGENLPEEAGRRLMIRLGVSNDIINGFYARTLSLADLRELHALIRQNDSFYDVQVEVTGGFEGTIGAPWPFRGEVTLKPEVKANMPLAAADEGYDAAREFVVTTVTDLKPILEQALRESVTQLGNIIADTWNSFRDQVYRFFDGQPPWIVRRIIGD